MADPIRRTLEELRAAGAPDFFERDPSVLKALMKAEFEERSGRTLYPAQTEMFLIEVAAYALSLLHEAAQTATLQNTAVWAEGRHLEDRGTNVSTFRLLAQPARATLRFTLSMARPNQVAVPAGTRAASPGGIVLATDADLIIPAGSTQGEIGATATMPGAAWNGLAPGAVSDLLDPVAWVSAVENIDPVDGGTDVENEQRFRGRVVNALFTIAKTGPRNGYREHVLAVDPDIVDVAVIRPEPGHIHIHPLLSTGLPDAALKATITAYLDPETLRAMGDDVAVLDPVRVGFEFEVTVRSLTAVPGIEDAAEAAIIAAFRPWTQSLGSQIAPSDIIRAVRKLAGVTDVETDLEFSDLAAHQFAGIDALVVAVEVTPNV